MISSSKQIRKKTQNTEKNSFFEKIDKKCRFIQIHNEQNDDHQQIMHKILFHSFFKSLH